MKLLHVLAIIVLFSIISLIQFVSGHHHHHHHHSSSSSKSSSGHHHHHHHGKRSSSHSSHHHHGKRSADHHHGHGHGHHHGKRNVENAAPEVTETTTQHFLSSATQKPDLWKDVSALNVEELDIPDNVDITQKAISGLSFDLQKDGANSSLFERVLPSLKELIELNRISQSNGTTGQFLNISGLL